ncbi:MAG: transketolase [Candidatus Pacebacteria bacterium]|nr:transketolase [Candidatus Paceibacterota bacterium]
MPLFSSLSSKQKKFLEKTAQEIRVKVIKMIAQAGSGHPAGSLGMADVLTALYFQVMSYQPHNPNWDKRDYLILSNGHICPVLYAALAQAGFYDQKMLNKLRQINSPLEGHPHRNALPGIETSSGPLGQGISQAAGLALALKIDQKNNHIFCLMSDGEQQEGQTWEAYQLINKYQLDNLTVIIDRNNIQIDGQTSAVMPLEPFEKKLSSFGFKTKTVDGHDFNQLVKNLEAAKNNGQPTAIIAQTVPGKGVSFMENDNNWHGKAPDQKQAAQAIKELTHD